MFLTRVGKTVLLLLLLMVVSETVEAQRSTRTRTREDSRNTRSRDRNASSNDLAPWYAISLGTLGFGSGFSISGKFAYALKYGNRVSLGAYGKGFYNLINNFNAPDEGLIDFGGGAFTRLNITDDIFLQGEYSYTSFEQIGRSRFTKLYPAVGGGYKAGYGDWTYGFHILLPLDEQVRDIVNLEYWIDFNHKF